MTSEKNTRDPAPHKEEVLDQSTVDVLLNVRPEDLIGHDPEWEVIKGSAFRSGGWLHAPAQLELFAAADRRLTRVALQLGMTVKRVEKVQPRLVRGTKLLIIKPASVDDLTANPVNRYAGTSATWINLANLLGEAGFTLETGYRERYDVAYIPKGSPLWPGLVIDLNQPKERRLEPTRKKSAKQSTATKTEPAKAADAT